MEIIYLTDVEVIKNSKIYIYGAGELAHDTVR